MVIRQGDVYWLDLGEPVGSAPGYRHPHVVIQNDAANLSKIETVVLCGITSNLRRASSPGNVLLDAGEAHLAKPSVVNVSQLFTVDKSELIEKVGTLSFDSLRRVVDGVQAFVEPIELEDWEEDR